MSRAQSMKFGGGLLLLALVMAGQALMPSVAESSLLAGAFFDAGHVPLFTVFALLVYWLSRSTVPGSGARHYAIAFALVVIAGLGTEFIQKFGARDAGFADFLRDLMGGAAGILLAFAFGGGRWGPRVVAIVVAVALLGAGVAELGLVWRDYRARDASFPALAGFDAAWEPRFVHGHDADLAGVPAPEAWTGASGTIVGRLDARVADYPSLSIREPHPDWSGYAALEFEVWSDLPATAELTVRIHDRQHNGAFTDRYNGVFKVDPGLNRVSVPLEDVRTAPRGRELDLERVAGVAIFLDHPTEPVRLWFGGLGLVGDAP